MTKFRSNLNVLTSMDLIIINKIRLFFMYSRILLANVFLLLLSCNSFNKKLVTNTNNVKEDAIKNAILDFSNNSRIYKKESVFYVAIEEKETYNDFIIVSIGANDWKILYSEKLAAKDQIGIPSKYFERDEKLFFWHDDKSKLTEETLTVFDKYNLLQDDKNGLIKGPSHINTENRKITYYYFCKNDLLRYKKVKTILAVGSHKSPKLSCDEP